MVAIDMIFFKQYGDFEFWFTNQIALTVKVNCWKYLSGTFAFKVITLQNTLLDELHGNR